MADRAAVATRRADALRRRVSGEDYATITRELGYSSEATCRKDLSRAMAQAVPEAGKEALALQMRRLDTLAAALWLLVDKKQDVHAARELVRLEALRSRLLGLERLAAITVAKEADADGIEAARESLGIVGALLTYANQQTLRDDTDPRD